MNLRGVLLIGLFCFPSISGMNFPLISGMNQAELLRLQEENERLRMLAAIQRDNVALVRKFITQNPAYLNKIRVKKCEFSPLAKAIGDKSAKVAIHLINNGAELDIYVRDFSDPRCLKAMPLLIYAWTHMLQLIPLMVKKGIDFNNLTTPQIESLVRESLDNKSRFRSLFCLINAGMPVLKKNALGKIALDLDLDGSDERQERALLMVEHAIKYTREHNLPALQDVISYVKHNESPALKWGLLKYCLSHNPKELDYTNLARNLAKNLHDAQFLPSRVNTQYDGNTLLHHIGMNSDNVPEHDPFLNAKAKWLLLHGANPNIQNNQGLTPLHIAISKGNKALVSLLLGNRANMLIEDKNGFNAIHYALQQIGPHPQMLWLMISPKERLSKKIHKAGVSAIGWLFGKMSLQ